VSSTVRRFINKGPSGIAQAVGRREYSPETLLTRGWQPALAAALRPGLLALRNGTQVNPSIYLHFILTLDRA
jgi:hypothetical protein